MATPDFVFSENSAMGGNGTDTTITIEVPSSLAGNCGCLIYQTSGAGVINTVTDNTATGWTSIFPAVIAGNQHMWAYARTNMPAGVHTLTINFTTPDAFDQFIYLEMYNISTAAVASAISDKQSATAQAGSPVATPALAAGAGDMVIHVVNCDSGTLPTGFTAGSGFTLKSANVMPGAGLVAIAMQWQIASGPVTPSMGLVGGGAASSDTLSIAFKSAAAGTAPPPGVRVAAVQKSDFTSDHGTLVYQFPHIGNLIGVESYNGLASTVTMSISDGDSNTYVDKHFAPTNTQTRLNLPYAPGVAPNTNMTGPTLTFSSTGSTAQIGFTTLYDIVGADPTNPFAQLVTAQGTQSVTGNLSTLSITPINANNVVLYSAVIISHTVSGLNSPSAANGGVGLNFVFPATDGGGSTEEDDDAHMYGQNLPQSSQTFILAIQNNVGGVGDWAALGLELQAPSSGPVNLMGMPSRPMALFSPRHGPSRGLRPTRAFPVGNIPLALSARGTLALQGRGGLSGALGLTARATVQAKSRAAAAGTVPLSGRATMQVKQAAKPTGIVALAARATLQVKTAAAAVGTAALVARATLQMKAAAAATGAAALAGRAAMQVKTAAAATGVVGLAGRAALMVQARSQITFGLVQLSARMTIAMAGRLAAPVMNAALSGRATMQAKSRAAATGIVGLSARATMQTKAAGTAASIINLVGRLTAMVFGRGKPQVGTGTVVQLSGRMTIAVSGQLSTPLLTPQQTFTNTTQMHNALVAGIGNMDINTNPPLDAGISSLGEV